MEEQRERGWQEETGSELEKALVIMGLTCIVKDVLRLLSWQQVPLGVEPSPQTLIS